MLGRFGTGRLMRCAGSAVLFFVLAVLPARAQGDLDAARTSLEGVTSFGVRVTVEGPRSLTESEVLSTLTGRVADSLRARDLPATASGERSPFLHVHLNMMYLENGLVPFAIDLDFYQDVRLRTNGLEASGVTWSESVLGLVSYDQLPVIVDGIDELAAQFAADFEAAN